MGLISRVSSRTYRILNNLLTNFYKMAEEETQTTLTYEDQLVACNEIAKPMASKKLAKRLYKAMKEARKSKNQVRMGVKEVTKALKKNEKGFVIFAGDVQPVEIYCHLVGVCESKNIPYCYTPSKQMLGATLNSKRSTCVILVKKTDDDTYSKATEGIKK